MRKFTKICPNCDANLPHIVFDGEGWDCPSCCEHGTYKARPESGFEATLICSGCHNSNGVYREYSTNPPEKSRVVSVVLCDDCTARMTGCSLCGNPIDGQGVYTVKLADDEFTHLDCYDRWVEDGLIPDTAKRPAPLPGDNDVFLDF